MLQPKLRPHVRIKPKAKVAPNAAEQAHWDRVVRLGCLVCGSAASLHHIMVMPGKIRRRDHRFVVPLCQNCHQGDLGVHGLGSEAAFQRMHDIDLAARAKELWDEFVMLTDG